MYMIGLHTNKWTGVWLRRYGWKASDQINRFAIVHLVILIALYPLKKRLVGKHIEADADVKQAATFWVQTFGSD